MDVLIVSPAAPVQNGNSATADEWADALRSLGHQVRIAREFDGERADLLVAIHAHKSHSAIEAFHQTHREGRIIVALAGTDLYPALSPTSLKSLALADRIVVLQRYARERIPTEHRAKTFVIRLTAPAPPDVSRDASKSESFVVAVVGHLREVKDPMRTAAASRLLPADSAILVQHVGAVLDEQYADEIEAELRENPRYKWLGALSEEEVYKLIASSDLFVLSSISEGGARVLSEAVMAGTPILASRNDASTSLLGDHYPGLFEPKDTEGLAALLHRSETDTEFLADLTRRVEENAARCSESRERESWHDLLTDLFPNEILTPLDS